jgi:hypothetical protein
MRKLYLFKIFTYLKIVLVLTLVFFLVSCDNSTNPLDFNLLSTQEDVQLGQQLDNEILNNPKDYPILSLPQHIQYVQNIVNEIIQLPIVCQIKLFIFYESY